MATLFYENCDNIGKQWTGGNGMSVGITSTNDPLGKNDVVCTFSRTARKPDSFSSGIYNPNKLYAIAFDYLGKSKNIAVGANYGCTLSIADGAALSGLTYLYSGDITSLRGPMCDTRIVKPNDCIDECQEPGPHYHGCVSWYSFYIDYYKSSTYVDLNGNGNWQHFSFVFSTSNENIRLALGDYLYGNREDQAVPGDCYFDNIILTDMNGPDPFFATASADIFTAISIDAISKSINTVSYINSNQKVTINLKTNYFNGGYANGDKLNNIDNLIGSNYSDNLTGNDNDNVLNASDGNDILQTSHGSDILTGGQGLDIFIISEDIDTTTITDFNPNQDILDFSQLNFFYSLQQLKSLTTYSNGNSKITISPNKELILLNFNLLTNDDIQIIFSTYAPSFSPTYSPTTSSPTISLDPTLSPTLSPTLEPTPSPTKEYNTILITEGGIHNATSSKDAIMIKSSFNTKIYGLEGEDKFIIYQFPHTTIEIADFDPHNEVIDLSNLEYYKNIEDLEIKDNNLRIILENDQIILLPQHLSSNDLSLGNFHFYENYNSSTSEESTDICLETSLFISSLVGTAFFSLILGGCIGHFCISEGVKILP